MTCDVGRCGCVMCLHYRYFCVVLRSNFRPMGMNDRTHVFFSPTVSPHHRSPLLLPGPGRSQHAWVIADPGAKTMYATLYFPAPTSRVRALRFSFALAPARSSTFVDMLFFSPTTQRTFHIKVIRLFAGKSKKPHASDTRPRDRLRSTYVRM